MIWASHCLFTIAREFQNMYHLTFSLACQSKAFSHVGLTVLTVLTSCSPNLKSYWNLAERRYCQRLPKTTRISKEAGPPRYLLYIIQMARHEELAVTKKGELGCSHQNCCCCCCDRAATSLCRCCNRGLVRRLVPASPHCWGRCSLHMGPLCCSSCIFCSIVFCSHFGIMWQHSYDQQYFSPCEDIYDYIL